MAEIVRLRDPPGPPRTTEELADVLLAMKLDEQLALCDRAERRNADNPQMLDHIRALREFFLRRWRG